MFWLRLEGVSETPIALPRRSEAGNLYESLPEVPGTAVRGAFAGKYIRRQGWTDSVPENEEGEKFERWFENLRVRFGPLRPIPKDLPAEFDKAVPVPVPRSARSCKYEPGFGFADKHGVFDSLLFQVGAGVSASPADDEHFNEKMRKCPCGAPIEALESTWLVANWNNAKTKFSHSSWGIDYDAVFRLSTHVGIGPAVGEDANLSDEGRLFSLQHFPAETRFRGWIAVGNGTPEEVLEALGFTGLGEAHALTIRVGRRSRSYGALKVWVTEPKAFGVGEPCEQITPPPWERSHGSLASRFDKFQEEAKKPLAFGVGEPCEHIPSRLLPEDFGEDFAVFSVTCLTDLILLDDFLRPCRAITAFQMARRFGLDWCASKPSVWRVGALTGTRLIGGWNTAHRLPKENESAIVAGSVFLFAVRNDALEKEKLFEKLADLENNGIGWRRSEGFGQVLICDQFHLQAEDESLERPAVRLKAPSAKAEPELKKSPYPLEQAVVNFFKQKRSLLFSNNQSVLTKTQINSLRDRVQRYELAAQTTSDISAESPKERLKEYLQHKADLDRTKQPLMQALIELFELDGEIPWQNVRRRVDDFVRAMLLSVESPDVKIDELASRLINKSGKEEKK